VNKNLLPCPFCGAELQHRTFRVVFADDIWEHPKDTDCPLSKTGLGDPFHVFDNQSDIESWNKRTTPAQLAQRKPLTDDQIKEIWLNGKDHGDDWLDVQGIARAIEAAHNIKP
jgi:hypothetical protein